MYIGVRECLSV